MNGPLALQCLIRCKTDTLVHRFFFSLSTSLYIQRSWWWNVREYARVLQISHLWLDYAVFKSCLDRWLWWWSINIGYVQFGWVFLNGGMQRWQKWLYVIILFLTILLCQKLHWFDQNFFLYFYTIYTIQHSWITSIF